MKKRTLLQLPRILAAMLVSALCLCSCKQMQARENSKYSSTAEKAFLPPAVPSDVLVVLAPPHQEYRAGLTEETLKKFGCEYRISDQIIIGRLINSVEKSHISGRITDLVKLDLREAVYMKYTDRPPIKLLLRAPFPGEVRLPGFVDDAPISIDAGIVEKIYELVANLGIDDGCSFFVRAGK
ncbi:hypothetical protein [Ralstonia psammae]|uniref:hypothetical protein n=1 Tax=Ralstonia psammae TaxID=3058598 RepID=UPI002930928B|nr:hypothetical protein [Ralstonia sp. LMG 19083]